MHLDKRAADCQYVRRELQSIDKLFEVAFDWDSASYHVTFNGGHFQTIPYGTLTRETFEDIRHTYWLNATGQILDYVDEQNEILEARQDREQSNMAEALAKDLRKPLVNDYLYGG